LDADAGTRLADIEALYRRDHTRVVRLAYLITGDRSFAEDAAQEAFARLVRTASTVESPAAFVTTVTINLCRDHGRRAATVRRNPTAAPGTSPSPDLPRETDRIWQAVQRLPDSHRQAVVLRYWADMTTAQIARVLDSPPGTIRSTLHRALDSLKGVLDDE
jgi:RNA polymerase sigma factor (sigma-70 family)